ncbi:MAG TPA: ATP-binding protein [Minicystis sp.]|nr:ATP-binding protein [Minicystis sp.]
MLTFRTKLLASHVGLVAAIVVLVIAVLDVSLGGDLERQLDARLQQQALGAAQWVNAGRHPERLASRLAVVVNAKVTITDKDGNLIGDSDLEEGAATRAPPIGSLPEIAAVRAGGVGRATRKSDKGEDMHYLAVPTESGLVLRLGVPLSGIHETLGAMQRRLLLASALALVAALGLGIFASRLAAAPLRAMNANASRIAQGDYDIAVASAAPDEFGALSRTLAALAAQLKARIGDLTAERDRLTAILAGMQEGVVVTGEGGAVVVANPAAERLLANRAPLVGEAAERAFALPALRDVVRRAEVTGATAEGEIEDEAAGRSLAAYVRPLEGGVVAVLRDMTALRRLERVRRDFVANASHELRTPVTAIQGYAETLLRGTADAATSRQFLEIVHRHARRLGALLESLLRLSELEARTPDSSVREPVRMRVVLTEVEEAVQARAEAVGARVEVVCDASALALGDPLGLEQVVENLVDNALKYGKPSGGRVEITARAAGGRVRVTVADDGPGIEAKHLPRLFERFYRVDPARSRERGGSGLGLAIVRHLVESMEGAVSVESELGKGTVFAVDVPAAKL